jgi:hypothetical protein
MPFYEPVEENTKNVFLDKYPPVYVISIPVSV